MFWEGLLYILEKLLLKLQLHSYKCAATCVLFLRVFLCIPIATILGPSSRFQRISLPPFAPDEVLLG